MNKKDTLYVLTYYNIPYKIIKPSSHEYVSVLHGDFSREFILAIDRVVGFIFEGWTLLKVLMHLLMIHPYE